MLRVANIGKCLYGSPGLGGLSAALMPLRAHEIASNTSTFPHLDKSSIVTFDQAIMSKRSGLKLQGI